MWPTLVLIVLVLTIGGFAVGGIAGAPWVPTFRKDIHALLDDCGLKKSGKLIELGCGDGRLVKAAAKRGIQVTGYEINPLLFLFAWARNLGYPNAHVRLGNFWNKDWSQADAVITFLIPRSMGKIEAKAEKELKPDSRLISYVFPLPNKKPAHKRLCWFVYDY